MTKQHRAAPALLCALACAACGGQAPPPAASPARSPLAEANATHEYPSPPPPRQTAAQPAPGPDSAIRSFATAYINWNAQTVSADMRALAARSIGQARAAMSLAAAQTGSDYELQRGGIANAGAVEAVAPRDGHHDAYVVVTLESTTATDTTAYQGLKPAWHLALATVTEEGPGQWVVSGWQPES